MKQMIVIYLQQMRTSAPRAQNKLSLKIVSADLMPPG